jgi:hypothetical protein
MQTIGGGDVVRHRCSDPDAPAPCAERDGALRRTARSLPSHARPRAATTWLLASLLFCVATLTFGEPARAGTTGGIAGIASAWDGTRVANLPIVLLNPATGMLTTTTDRKGFFVILSLPPGQYVFLNTHVGADFFFNADCLGISVHADQVSQVHLWLEREWTGSGCDNDIESFLPAVPRSG